jgi:hypothetical protein
MIYPKDAVSNNFLRHTRAGGYPDSFERFSPWRWIPAYAGMTESYCLPDPKHDLSTIKTA